LGVGLDFLSRKRPFGSTGTAEGDHMGQEFNLGGEACLPMLFGEMSVTPRIGLRYAYFHANGFGESGAGGQDLNLGTDNVRSLQPYVGVTIDRAFGDALKPVNAELRIRLCAVRASWSSASSIASSITRFADRLLRLLERRLREALDPDCQAVGRKTGCACAGAADDGVTFTHKLQRAAGFFQPQ